MGYSDRGYYRSEPSNSFLQEWTGVLTIIVANIAVWVANLLGANEFPLNRFLALEGDLPQHLQLLEQPLLVLRLGAAEDEIGAREQLVLLRLRQIEELAAHEDAPFGRLVLTKDVHIACDGRGGLCRVSSDHHDAHAR